MANKPSAVEKPMPAEEVQEETAPVTSPVTTSQTISQSSFTTQQKSQLDSVRSRRWYEGYPKILAGVCEFCGEPYQKCQHYAHHYAKHGEFTCMCGQSIKPGAKQQLALLYVPHRGVFICDSKGCEDAYFKRFGGFEKHVSWMFFVREVPWYGVQLADPVDTTTLNT